MRKQLRLRETIPTPKLKGIFFNLASSEEFEYINNDNKVSLNVDYYDIYSKDKCASQFFDKTASDIVYIDDGDAVYIDDYDFIGINRSYDDIYNDLSSIIITQYKNKWDRIYEVLVEATYKPLENYNMLQELIPDLTDLKTLNLSDLNTLNLTDLRTPNLHTDNKTSLSQNVTNIEDVNRFGFNDNGTSGSPFEKKTNNTSSSPQTNYTDVDIDESGTDTTTHTGTDTTTHKGKETLTRSGNIGVTTSQQMLESEIKLRALNNMIKIIFDDIDKVLTNPIYII